MSRESILVGTVDGLYEMGGGGPTELLGGRRVTALAPTASGDGWLALVDGDSLWRTSDHGPEWQPIVSLAPWHPTCLGDAGPAVLVGTAGAHLLRISHGEAEPVAGFDDADDRESWYTPWGAPPDTRSIAAGGETVYVNVHVGGILRSGDGGATWEPTIDIDADVHQVLTLTSPSRVLAAGAFGLSLSDDGGSTWRLETEGLHAGYLRAVAVAGDTLLVSASEGPGGGQAAVYRRALAGGAFERCRQGLPEWFAGNIDTGCLAASGDSVALGTPDGSVYWSEDAGRSWALRASGLPQVTSVGV